VRESEVSIVLDRLLADRDEMARVIEALSWGDESPLADLSPASRGALKAWLTRWLFEQARVQRRPCRAA
jgi:hypothetical protein